MAKKFGLADQMFKNIKVENNLPEAEDVLREMNRGSWSTGYCGQSPERLKAHMKNQAKFDMLTMRAPKDDPEVGGDYYGLPWPCWGSPEVRHPGTPLLYNTNLHVMDGGGTFRAALWSSSARRSFPTARRARSACSADGSYSKGSAIKDGYPEFTLASPEEARLGHGPDGSRNGRHQQGQSRQSRRGVVVARLVGRYPARRADARLRSLRQRQGAHECVRPAGSDSGSSRADLHAARRSGLEISDAAGCQAVPHAQYRLLRAEGRGGKGDSQAISAHPLLGPSGRI